MTDITGQLCIKLRRLMNACVRFIYDLRWDDHVSPYYSQLGWLQTDDRRSYLLGCFIFLNLHIGIPSYLACKLSPCHRRRATTRASPLDLAVPTCRTSTFQRSFTAAAPTFWNSLPTRIRGADLLDSFKRDLFRFLQQRAAPQPLG
ncbi:uncharacterized protein LOC120357292 [Solenopsis invicta]|uniref:uncharacterized protein LOC120357292 n=1 Tax=Solenopsis invicta TaxID=13686 RepID=UPI000595E7D1|nr:uncharacterized protein LOC120357292 [Solenopsis invicta]